MIRRDGDGHVRQDLARHTDARAAPRHNGRHGTGPFRSPAPVYRSTAPPPPDGGTATPRRRVPLIGARTTVLARLAAAPRTLHTGAGTAPDLTDATAGEPRQYGADTRGDTVPGVARAAVPAALTIAVPAALTTAGVDATRAGVPAAVRGRSPLVAPAPESVLVTAVPPAAPHGGDRKDPAESPAPRR
ncbi:hypothetical protein GCM10010238_22780 [Streptomyces griseoviridis]|uniref:Uncharacterized protein n=1 Tax=Streptomyces griseoviridis TaxID=45398 RepID=A0A918GHH6_STRGD|nr:hypothetical protein GCM10010238_22780 [Streptomyces niveoruber]